MNSTYTPCPGGMNSEDLCILLPSDFCSLFLPPGMYFVRKILAVLISLLSLIIIKYMVFVSFWKNEILNGPPLQTLWQFRNVLLQKYPKEKPIHFGTLQKKKRNWYFHQHDETLPETLLETWKDD